MDGTAGMPAGFVAISPRLGAVAAYMNSNTSPALNVRVIAFQNSASKLVR